MNIVTFILSLTMAVGCSIREKSLKRPLRIDKVSFKKMQDTSFIKQNEAQNLQAWMAAASQALGDKKEKNVDLLVVLAEGRRCSEALDSFLEQRNILQSLRDVEEDYKNNELNVISMKNIITEAAKKLRGSDYEYILEDIPNPVEDNNSDYAFMVQVAYTANYREEGEWEGGRKTEKGVFKIQGKANAELIELSFYSDSFNISYALNKTGTEFRIAESSKERTIKSIHTKDKLQGFWILDSGEVKIEITPKEFRFKRVEDSDWQTDKYVNLEEEDGRLYCIDTSDPRFNPEERKRGKEQNQKEMEQNKKQMEREEERRKKQKEIREKIKKEAEEKRRRETNTPPPP